MKKSREKWRSPSLGKDMTVNIYGDSGTPVIGLPTRGQKSGQWEEYGMIEAIGHQLENGYNQLFCVDTIDEEAFLNKETDPEQRLMRRQQFEDYILEELVPYIRNNNTNPYLMIAGVDLGGYHAVNIALKNPDAFDKAIGISGMYDIKTFLDGFYDDTVYYNNPVDFLPNLNESVLLGAIREVDFRLVSYRNDERADSAHRMAHVFRAKFIDHELDIWDLTTDKEWDLWTKMLTTHIIS